MWQGVLKSKQCIYLKTSLLLKEWRFFLNEWQMSVISAEPVNWDVVSLCGKAARTQYMSKSWLSHDFNCVRLSHMSAGMIQILTKGFNTAHKKMLSELPKYSFWGSLYFACIQMVTVQASRPTLPVSRFYHGTVHGHSSCVIYDKCFTHQACYGFWSVTLTDRLLSNCGIQNYHVTKNTYKYKMLQ